MSNQIPYTKARAHLAELCEQVTANRDIVIINRRGSDDVALISAEDLSSLVETAYLLKSPKNARRLLRALDRAKSGKLKSQSIEKLRREMGIASEG